MIASGFFAQSVLRGGTLTSNWQLLPPATYVVNINHTVLTDRYSQFIRLRSWPVPSPSAVINSGLRRRVTESCYYVQRLTRFYRARVFVQDNGELQPRRLTGSVYR